MGLSWVIPQILSTWTDRVNRDRKGDVQVLRRQGQAWCFTRSRLSDRRLKIRADVSSELQEWNVIHWYDPVRQPLPLSPTLCENSILPPLPQPVLGYGALVWSQWDAYFKVTWMPIPTLQVEKSGLEKAVYSRWELSWSARASPSTLPTQCHRNQALAPFLSSRPLFLAGSLVLIHVCQWEKNRNVFSLMWFFFFRFERKRQACLPYWLFISVSTLLIGTQQTKVSCTVWIKFTEMAIK